MLVFLAIGRHLVETLTCVVHAVLVVGAVTARSERVPGHRHVVGNDGVVDEAEVRVQYLVVFVVNYGDWDRLVGGKRANLTPVAVLLLLWV